MNKSEIIEAAKVAQAWLDDESGASPTLQVNFAVNLISAARLLEMVEVVTVEEIEHLLHEGLFYCENKDSMDMDVPKTAQAIHNLIYNRPVITIKKGEV